MAMLWNSLRQEVMGTVDDFRTKGALGALRDAAFDAGDMVSDAGSWLKTLVDGEEAVLRAAALPAVGAKAPLEFVDGRVVEATVLDVDALSDPPRARVAAAGLSDPLLVAVLAPGAEGQRGVLGSLKQEFKDTVQDFREKGAVGAFKDAALDAVDLVGDTAGKAANGARSLASDLIDLEEEGGPAEEAAPGSQPRGSVLQLVDGLKQEIKGTVQDLREKGAVATFKDAALDAVDIVGSTATTAVTGARSMAAPLLEQVGPLPDMWASQAQEEQQQPAAALPAPSTSSSSTAPVPSAPMPVAATPSPSPAPAGGYEATPAPKASAPASPKEGAAGGYKATPAPKASAPASPKAAAAPEAPPSPAKPAAEVPGTQAPQQRPARPSIVSMRRSMFEKPKEEPKHEQEELID